MSPFVCQVHPPERIHLFQQLDVSRSDLQLLQSPHASLKCLRGLIAGLGLSCNKQPSVYAGLLLLETVGLLADSSIVIVGLGLRFCVISSGIVKL